VDDSASESELSAAASSGLDAEAFMGASQELGLFVTTA
jgi:hypothetical protein